jgi:hypothetical protein
MLASPAGGKVNAALQNEMAYYSVAGDIVSGLATANNSILATNASGVPAFTTSLPTQVQVSPGSLDGGVGANSTTYWRGDGIWFEPVGTGTVNPGLINQLSYYATSGDIVSGLVTANNGILVTSGTGVPSIASTLPSLVQSNITSVGIVTAGTWNGNVVGITYGGTGTTTATGTGSLVLQSSPTLIAPLLGTPLSGLLTNCN